MRELPLLSSAVPHLECWREVQDELRRRAGAAWRPGGYVFTTLTVGPLEARNVRRHFKQTVARLNALGAGLPPIRVHDLRHTYGTNLRRAGVDLEVIKELMGHSQISVTSTFYGHVVQELHRDAAERLERLLSPRPAGSRPRAGQRRRTGHRA